MPGAPEYSVYRQYAFCFYPEQYRERCHLRPGKSSLLHLQEIRALKALQPHTSARSGLQSLLFFYVVEGSGELTYQGQKAAESRLYFQDLDTVSGSGQR